MELEGASGVDIDALRMDHENDVEWGLRRTFLVAHQDKFPPDRLKCLANCFVNVEIYGNRYPDEVMRQLRELMEDTKEETAEFRETIEKRTKVRFVKWSNFGSAPPQSSKESRKDTAGFVQSPTKFQHTGEQKHLSKKEKKKLSRSKKKSHGQTQDHSGSGASIKICQKHVAETVQEIYERSEVPVDEKFYNLAKMLREVQSNAKNSQTKIASCALCMAADKVQMSLTTDVIVKPTDTGGQMPVCTLKIDFIHVATSSSGIKSKKKVKTDAFKKAVEMFSKPYLRVVQLNPEKRELQASDEPFATASSSEMQKPEPSSPRIMTLGKHTIANISPLASATVQGKKSPIPVAQRPTRKKGKPYVIDFGFQDLSNFVILENRRDEDRPNPVRVLNGSARFCKMRFSYDHDNMNGIERGCVVKIGGHVVADVQGPYNLRSAKIAAAQQALDTLQKTCYTLWIKQEADTQSGLSKDEVFGAQQDRAIPDSNIGRKLLKMMGWSGGGIGKHSQGITEPLSVRSVINRQGLGMAEKKEVQHDLGKHIKRVIKDYAKSDNQEDLAFTSEFTKEERALIHEECKNWTKLKTKSAGKGDERYLIVSRVIDSKQLLTHVMQQGGETSKYLLVPPGGGH